MGKSKWSEQPILFSKVGKSFSKKLKAENHSLPQRSRNIFETLFLAVLSRVTGAISEWRLPTFMAESILGVLAKLLKMNLSEANLPLNAMSSFQDMFTRTLKPGVRPISGDLSFPCDGFLTEFGLIDHTLQATQIKGKTYSLQELVGSYSAKSFVGGTFATIYLAPSHYHRVHSPIEGRIRQIQYISGALWPVNPPAVSWIPNLFTRNERLVFILESEVRGPLAVVMVGALNVGKLRTPSTGTFP